LLDFLARLARNERSVAPSAETCSPPGLRFQESPSIPAPTVGKAQTLHARSGLVAEDNVSLCCRIQVAQENLSHRQKRHFLITEAGSPALLNASFAGMVFDRLSDRRLHSVPLNL
jgi:hypothetical protein